MAARSFQEAVARAQSTKTARPTDEGAVMVPAPLSDDYAAALDGVEVVTDAMIEQYLQRQAEKERQEAEQRKAAAAAEQQRLLDQQQRADAVHASAQAYQQAPQPTMPAPMPQMGGDAGSMMAMLVQQNQQLQQQVMRLTDQLAQMVQQIGQGGGGQVNGQAPRQQPIRGDQMTEAQRWQAMHGDGGLLG